MSRPGEGKLGCAIWLVLLGIAVMIGWKAVPVKIRTAEFEDYMVEQAKFSGRASPEAIAGRILRRARDLRIPLDKKNVKVEKYSGRVRMEVTYEIPLEFPFYTFIWKFHHEVDRPIFLV